MSAIIVGSAVIGLISADMQSGAIQDAASDQTQANADALAQNQAQFEASMALQERLAAEANATQMNIANMSIAEQQRQFEEVQAVLAPFVTAGNQALTDLKPYETAGAEALMQQKALAGLGTAAEQQAAIDAIANGVQMQSLVAEGENAILQNASATGGLRGGNTQSALAQFRPAALSALIDTQYSRLSGITSLGAATTGSIAQLGQASAAQQASSATALGNGIASAFGNAASNISQLSSQNASAMAGLNSQYAADQSALTQQAGAISAGATLAQAQTQANALNSLGSTFSTMAFLNSLKGTTGLGAGTSTYGTSYANPSNTAMTTAPTF
jgi:hypothetical protein